jgi:hypothetical protein
VSNVNVPKYLRSALQTRKLIRNGAYPDVAVQSWYDDETNRIVAYRLKSASFSTSIPSIPTLTSTSRPRWRGVIHTSTFCQYLWVKMVLAQTNLGSGAGGASGDPYGLLTVKDVGGSTIGTAEAHYGANPAATVNDFPANFGTFVMPLQSGGAPAAIAPDTDYYLTFTDEQAARMVSACVYEIAMPTDTANGYLASGAVVGAPIFDSDRQGVITTLRKAWQKGAAGLWWLSSDTDGTAPTNATNTLKNFCDTSLSSPPATAHPGVTLDLSSRSHLSIVSLGVPCAFFAFGKHSVGGAGAGRVLLLNSGGTSMGGVNGFGTTAGWLSTTFWLPATSDRYFVYFANNGVAGTQTTYAVSLIQFE